MQAGGGAAFLVATTWFGIKSAALKQEIEGKRLKHKQLLHSLHDMTYYVSDKYSPSAGTRYK